MNARRTRARRQNQAKDQAPDFAAALRVTLRRHSDYVSGHEMQATLVALLSTSHATRRALIQWATEQLPRDITRGHDGVVAIRVHTLSTASLRALLLLLRFQYTTRVLIPVARECHALPSGEQDRLRRENDDVARAVRGCRVPLYAAYSEETGWGIHAAQRIPQAEYVGEYTGELLSSTEARRRHTSEYDHTRLNYVLALREQTRHGSGGVVRTNVDATRFGSYARFFNHSCAPTLRVEAVRVDSFVPRLVFFTQRALEIGEQLTFDYGCGASTPPAVSLEKTEAEEAAATEATPPGTASVVTCHCGAFSCRGEMPFDASL